MKDDTCGTWWREFYCTLRPGHTGPHQDIATVEIVPADSTSSECLADPRVRYEIQWGRDDQWANCVESQPSFEV